MQKNQTCLNSVSQNNNYERFYFYPHRSGFNSNDTLAMAE